mmetsp:Transcript_19160/g.56949  ORF Transcript_19160/g.56949 Transcript_19160/m.56949 type:complete len:271 (+) Transcript_19160:627-1439(+)
MVYVLPSRVVTSNGVRAERSTRMSGGCMRSASVMQLCSTGISLLSTSKLSSLPCFFMTSRCSWTAWSHERALCAVMKSPVHDVVIDDVCCPAKIVAMSMPQISSSVVCRPPYTFWYLASMNCCSTSSSRLPDARRAVTTFWKMARISSRATSRLRWHAMGRYGAIVDSGTMPSSSTCSRCDTRSNICSRTSRPSSVRAAVSVTSSENTSLKSITPESPQLLKNASASMTNSGTYFFNRSFFKASVKNRNCSVRTFWSTSYTTPLPKVGML